MTITFKELFNEGFLEKQAVSNLQLDYVLLVLAITLVLGAFIFLVYRLTFDGVIYSHRFNGSLIMVALITALIIMTIQSNVILSLGMVGALSIVRFRTALKDPMDIVYMFYAIAVGITTGTGLFYVAIFGTIFIGVVVMVLSFLKTDRHLHMLVLVCDIQAKEAVDGLVDPLKCRLKSRTKIADQLTLTYQVRVKKDFETRLKSLEATQGVHKVSLISYGESMI